MPLRALWVQKPPNAFDSDTEYPVERVEPKKQKWSPGGLVQVLRCGFQIVPDFAGTIHRIVEF